MKKILKRRFFDRPAAKVARELLGKFLVRRYRGGESALMITETEAYGGPEDMASHARFGRTERNKAMFGDGGIWYVYFTYGMHWMLNAVAHRPGFAGAVLIRGAAGIYGPARLTKRFKIDKKFNGRRINKETGLWLEDRGMAVGPAAVKTGKRIGVAYAGDWADKSCRFTLKLDIQHGKR